jgi:hypothetical protein
MTELVKGEFMLTEQDIKEGIGQLMFTLWDLQKQYKDLADKLPPKDPEPQLDNK